jgi:Arc/MetJ family transcription regulator
MAMTSVDVDLDILEQAGEILGTRTKRDTINAALREIVRRRAGDRLIDFLSGGGFEDLDADGVRQASWNLPPGPQAAV